MHRKSWQRLKSLTQVERTSRDHVVLKAKLEDIYSKLKALELAYTTQKIAFFRPNPASKGQQQFFQDQVASIRLVLGDNRSGKSVCGTVEAVAHSLGYRPWLPEGHPDRIVRLSSGDPIPVPNVGRVIAQDFGQAIKQNIWDKIREWCPLGFYTIKLNNQGVPVEVKWKNGSVWHIMSDEQKDEAFEGTRGHWFWADEPIGYKKYVALRRGLIDYSGHCWMTLTPLSQFWIMDIIESRANDPDGEVKVYRFNIEDNFTTAGGHVTQKMVDTVYGDLTEEERAARFGGQWLHMTGRVFKDWKPEPPYWVEPFEIPPTWPRLEICDPHPRKPIAVMWAAFSPDDQIYVYRDLFDDKLSTVTAVSDKVKEFEAGDPPTVMRIIDSSSKEHERTSGTSVWMKFADEGLPHYPAPKRNFDAGLDAIKEGLRIHGDWQEPRIVVFNTCPHVKRNFQRFIWDDSQTSKQRDLKGKSQKVVANHDDFIACIRYPLQAGVSYRMLKRELDNHDPTELETKGTKRDMAGWQTYFG
jgi:hypothetical protein